MDASNESTVLVCVRYVDHVLYNRTIAIAMRPQIRKAVGWLVYECDQYIILAWDRDDEPPTLNGEKTRASGLVLLKNDIIELTKFQSEAQESLGLDLNCKQPTQEDEYALRTTERKTRSPFPKGEKKP